MNNRHENTKEGLAEESGAGRFPRLDVCHNTETIDLNTLFGRDVTSSGSFDLGRVQATSLGRLLEALPVPVLVIDECHDIVFANQSWHKITAEYEKIEDSPFSSLFTDPSDIKKAASLLREAFSTGKAQATEAMLGIDRARLWGRVSFLSLKIGKSKSVLALIEDLTIAKKQLLLDQEHNARLRHDIEQRKRVEEALEQSKDELERRVKERTTELLNANERLRKEVSQSKNTEKALRESEERYRKLVEQSPDAVLVGMEGAIVFANHAAAGLCGATDPNGLIGRPVMDLVSPEHQETVRTRMERLAKAGGSTRAVEEKLVRLDGKTVDVSIRESLITFDGKPAIQVIVRDISELKQTESLLLQHERLQAVAELSDGVAHNFNNLLQIILGRAEFGLVDLENGDLAEVRYGLERILESSRFGAAIVGHLHDFTDILSGRALEEGEIFDFSSIVEQAISVSRPWWKTEPETEGYEILVQKDLCPGCLVEGQKGQLLAVVTSLIKNATEALPTGGHISIRTSLKQSEVTLTVEDDGIGIPKESIRAVFEPFWTAKGPQHVGMGLASGLGIVRRNQGEISFQSEPGKGTTFAVRLPLAQAPEKETELLAAEPAPDVKLDVLVIDDEPFVTKFLENSLKKRGHTVSIALSGPQAIEIFSETHFDLVICDLVMPEMNGWEVFERLRALSERRGRPKPAFILLTGWTGQAKEKERIADCGIDAVVDKPLTRRKFLEVVSRVMQSHDVR